MTGRCGVERLDEAVSVLELEKQYDFVVCGAGSSGSVVARRLAENPDVTVLLLEAGGTDDIPAVMNASEWPTNLGTARDWQFSASPSEYVNGRSVPMSMGKALGGGSSINVMAWARGHRNDWDFFASEAGDKGWSYDRVLDIYRRIEDWHGTPDPNYRGTGGPVFVAPAHDPNPIAMAAVDGAQSIGLPIYENYNGRMMEGAGGASIFDIRARGTMRESVFRSYVFPYLDRPNLTVYTDALVTRLLIDGDTVTGVEFIHDGQVARVAAASEVVLSLGAVHTPKVLMQSGIGDSTELRRHGIALVQHLPGVGRNFQDHPRIDCVWEYTQPLEPRNNASEMTVFWKSDPALDTPDIQLCQIEFALSSDENTARFGLPQHGWTFAAGVAKPKSRGQIHLTGPGPTDAVEIRANLLADPDDVAVAVAAVELCREVGNSAALRPYNKREVMPGDLKGQELVRFVRDVASTYWHQTGTAKMGLDELSVVDGNLKVYGVEHLRIADSSIMPRITTSNTMAPCVIIGERAAQMIRAEYRM